MRADLAQGAWHPVDVDGLEPLADEAVRSKSNVLVVAGPGAGKTELLAQRACFLLQAKVCPAPMRILAISFKRDAARNLKERVQSRCGTELAHRFDSLTFDSFSKGLMDRFREAIPQEWRPSADYRVLGGGELTERTIIDLVLSIPSDGSKLNEADRRGLSAKRLYWGSFLGRSLPLDTWPVRNLEDRAAAELWKHLLHGGQSSTLSFPMIGLLAELMLRTNPLILEALRKSYKYVFLDEFQDTSRVHYELTSTSFLQSTSVLTAVGDNKQRIMQWAGALDGIFDKYSKEFGARVLRLERNYRSGPELVRVQGLFARTLDPNCAEAIAMDDGSNGHGECRAFAYSSDDVEACHLARLVSSWIAQDKIVPRDICILTRLRNPAYTDKLRNTLRAQGVKSRVENEMQDLLAEPLTVVLINFIKLACSDSVPLACMRVRLSYPMSPLKPSDGIDFT